MATFSSLLGGVGLFLLGMWLMTDGLKLAAGATLRNILEHWTRSPARAFLAGFMITGIVQSSTATTVATVGFVNAGMLTLVQAVWVVVGANVGTTLTGWVVALVGLKISVTAMSLPFVGAGMLLRLAVRGNSRLGGLGQAMTGFGVFFMGLDILQGGFGHLDPGYGKLALADPSLTTLGLLVLSGLVLTLLTQSSSASIAIVLSAAATGNILLLPAAAIVIGINIGTTSTAALSAIGATPAAQRVAASHVIFNLVTGTCAFVLLGPLLWLSGAMAGIVGEEGSTPLILAIFHTVFSLLGTLLMAALGGYLVTWLQGRFTSREEMVGRAKYLDDNLLQVPAVALQGLVRETHRLLDLSFSMTRRILAGSRLGRFESEGLHQLAGTTRGFIGRMSSDQLPASVAAALPDVIRATQNIDDLVRGSGELQLYPDAATRAPDWRELLSALNDCLGFPDKSDAGEATRALEERQRRLDDAFLQLKQRLLRDAATGRLAVDAMGSQLTWAESCRNVGSLAIHACLRMARWVAVIDDCAMTDAPSSTESEPATISA
jgi:phosphate:Na+ symporter